MERASVSTISYAYLSVQCLQHLPEGGPGHRIAWYLYVVGDDEWGVGCPKESRESQGPLSTGTLLSGASSQQGRWLTSFSSSTERELGQVLLTDGIGVVQNGRAS